MTQNLSPETIELAPRVDSAEDVMKQLSAKLALILPLDAAAIEQAVRSRERARTTAFPNGAAIPHCRVGGLGRFGCALMILQEPIRWDYEGHAVDTILMIAGPAENISDHLRLLANSSQILDSPSLRSRLRQAPDARRAYELLTAAEEAVEQRRQETGMLCEVRGGLDRRAGDYLAEVANRFQWQTI